VITGASLLRSDLTVGVMTAGGTFWPASLMPSSGPGRTYQIAVQAGRPLSCWIWSRDYALSDSKGNPIAAGGTELPFQATTGADQVFTLSVTGGAKGN
jgi:hypothetical protein